MNKQLKLPSTFLSQYNLLHLYYYDHGYMHGYMLVVLLEIARHGNRIQSDLPRSNTRSRLPMQMSKV